MSFFVDDEPSTTNASLGPNALLLSSDQIALNQSIDFLLNAHAEDLADADEDHYSGATRDPLSSSTNDSIPVTPIMSTTTATTKTTRVWNHIHNNDDDDDDNDDDDDDETQKRSARQNKRTASNKKTPVTKTIDDDDNDDDENEEFVPTKKPTTANGASSAKKSRTNAVVSSTTTATTTATHSAASISHSPRVTVIYDQVKQCAVQVHDAERAQSEIAVPVTAASQLGVLAQLETLYGSLQSTLAQVVQAASDVLASELLSPPDIDRALWIKDEAVVLDCQCKCLQKEASELRQRPDAQPLPMLALAITAQPFPLTVIQNKALDQPVTLRLIRGTKTEIVSLGTVTASMLVDYAPRSAADTEVQNGTGTMSARELIVSMDKLKFKHGTRKKRALLKFRQQVQVRYKGGTVALDVESNASKPFVVKTNERQWREAEQSLLLLAAFGGRMRCSFAQVYNAFHHHLVGAVTKQLPSQPQRTLSAARALPFIAANFFSNAAQVTQTDFNNFWTWVGPTEHKLAHQRDLSNMFVDGLVLGFVTRAQSIELLRARDPGVFLIRFSLKYAGEFAISYRTVNSVKHYAIKQNDVVLVHLADFLLSSEYALRRVLAVDAATDQLIELDARAALRKHCSSNRDVAVPAGYEETISQALVGVQIED